MARKFTAADVEITAKDRTKAGINSAKGGVGGLTNAVKRYGMEMAAIVATIAAVTRVMKNLLDAHRQQEEAETKLKAALFATGNAVGISAEKMKMFAKEMQRTTLYGDEAILAAQGLMVTFTQIGREVFPDAIKAAADMSTMFGQDLQQSVIQLGTALNDPIAGVGRLRRIGISFTEDQKKMIATCMETNNIMGAQRVILDEIAREFGGVAQAAGETGYGALIKFKNAITDLKEVGGKAIADFLKPSVKLLTEFVTNTTNAIQETQRLKKIAAEMAKGQIVAAKDAAAVIQEQIKALETRIEMEKRLQIDPGIAQEELRMLKERLAALAEAARWEAIEATEREKGNRAAAAAAAEAAQRQRELAEWIEEVNAAYDKTEQGQRDILLAEIAKWEYELSRSKNYVPQIQAILDGLYKQRDANKEIKKTVEDAIIVFDEYGRVIKMASINVDNFADMEERARGTVKALTDAIKEQGEETEEQKKKQQEMLSIATQAVTAFGQTFAETAMEGGKVFKEAMKAAIASVVEALAAVEAGRAAAAFMTLNVVKGGMHMAAAALLYTTAAAIRALNEGGWLTEPVIGKGLHTGTTYTLAETGPEYVAPPDKMGPAGPSIVNHYHIRGSMITERQLIEKTAAAVAKALSYGY